VDKSRGRVAAMDGWRGISVSLVILYHLVQRYLGSFAGLSVQSGALGLCKKVFYELALSAGPLGVRIFFVISGFIITHLLLREEQTYGVVSLMSFYKRRIFRILPALYFFLAVIACLEFLDFLVLENDALSYSSTFLCDIYTEQCGWHLVHTWSLAVEEQFYLVWPLFFLFVPARYRIIPALTILIFCIVLAQIGATGARLFGMPISFASISAGVCLALSQRAQKLINTKVNGFIYIICFISIFMQPIIYHFSPALGLAANIAQPFLLCVVVFKPIFSKGPASRILEAPSLVYVGTISYSLYLWQATFTAPSEAYLGDSWLRYPLLMIIPALASYYFIEKPMVRLGAKIKRPSAGCSI